jgi:hypothetical protein
MGASLFENAPKAPEPTYASCQRAMQKNPARFPPGLLPAKLCKVTLYDTIDVTKSTAASQEYRTGAAHRSGAQERRTGAVHRSGPLDEHVLEGLDTLVRDQVMSMKTAFTPGTIAGGRRRPLARAGDAAVRGVIRGH